MMRLLLWLIVLSFALVTLRIALAAFLAFLAVGLLVALVRAPRQTLTVICALALLQAFNQYPLAGLLLMTAVIVLGPFAKGRKSDE
ncbi:hypothetical protein LPB140_03220 [Sphingorhabdus lutea]|uniref:Uncharacterized protein n=1 Tax=Sphingorhabdus lutea TaxID=1913578 RepID=A0A1L3JAA1_9SPHN|nr:hypothetical protein [Sphingorhabdus lutea]APG61993.1 hypothetical protein LPB140_03220 [Sphingorhabdus lutea]